MFIKNFFICLVDLRPGLVGFISYWPDGLAPKKLMLNLASLNEREDIWTVLKCELSQEF